MQIKLFLLPADADAGDVEEMNKFLRSNRIIDVVKQFVNSEGGKYWTFCVTYLPDSAKTEQSKRGIDYREVLPADEFAIFAKMRDVRKNLSQSDGIPPYAIFTNEELAELAKIALAEPLTLINMKKVNGIGNKKIEKYGTRFIELLSISDNKSLSNKEDFEDEKDSVPF